MARHLGRDSSIGWLRREGATAAEGTELPPGEAAAIATLTQPHGEAAQPVDSSARRRRSRRAGRRPCRSRVTTAGVRPRPAARRPTEQLLERPPRARACRRPLPPAPPRAVRRTCSAATRASSFADEATTSAVPTKPRSASWMSTMTGSRRTPDESISPGTEPAVSQSRLRPREAGLEAVAVVLVVMVGGEQRAHADAAAIGRPETISASAPLTTGTQSSARAA